MEVSGDSLNLQDAQAVTQLFREAAQANLATPGRTGCIVDLPDEGKLLVSGDLHDNREHFEAILKLARLDRSEQHHVVFQEVTHGSNLINNMDFSYRLLARIAALKVRRPGQVHHVLSNHELSQVQGKGILKDSISVVDAFNDGLAYVFGADADAVADAIAEFVKTMPLAVRTANGVLVSHSLPMPRKMDAFDRDIFKRPLTDADLADGGSAHMLVWGRSYTQEQADELAAHWGVKLFLLGHEHADMGCDERGQTMLVINSDHAHGAVVPVDLAASDLTQQSLLMEMLPLNAFL